MTEPGEWVGDWWVPGLDQRVVGILTYHPADGLSLRLVRMSSRSPFGESQNPNGLPFWPVLHGSVRGTPVTLLGVQCTGMETNFTERAAEFEARVDTFLHGLNLPDADDAVFVGATIEVDWLTAWSGVESLVSDDGSSVEVIALPVTMPSVAVGDWTVGLFHSLRYPSIGKCKAERYLQTSEAVSAYLRTDVPLSLMDALAPLDSIAHLMSLASLENCGVISESLTLPYPSDEDTLVRHDLRRVEVYRSHIVTSTGGGDGTHASFLLKSDDIAFEELLPRWLSLHEKQATVIGMVLGLRYLPDGFIEPRVVTAVGAAETLQNELDKSTEMPPEEHSALRRAVMKVVPDGRKQWVRERLASNKPKLSDRLVNLAGLLGEQVRDALLPDVQRWADRSVRARNHLAHTGETDFDGRELRAVVEVTSAVVMLVLLKRLGQSEERLLDAVKNHPEVNYARRLARLHFGTPHDAVQ